MKAFTPYFNFPGTTEEAFNFYKSILGGDFISVMRFKEFEHADKLPESDIEKIMHISLRTENGAILMATDVLESMGQKYKAGNNFYINIETESKEEADRIFNKLSEGGKVEMQMQDTFWGAYFGMFADRYGIQWMINFEKQNN
jgi:PhnB protein